MDSFTVLPWKKTTINRCGWWFSGNLAGFHENSQSSWKKSFSTPSAAGHSRDKQWLVTWGANHLTLKNVIGWNICQSKLNDPPLWGSGAVKIEADVCELNFLYCVWVVFRLNTSQNILGKNRWRLEQHQQSAVLFLWTSSQGLYYDADEQDLTLSDLRVRNELLTVCVLKQNASSLPTLQHRKYQQSSRLKWEDTAEHSLSRVRGHKDRWLAELVTS